MKVPVAAELLSGIVDLLPRHPDGETLARQLHGSLRRAILAGVLPSGHRLPSSREMARRLHVGRNTVTAAIDQLVLEGYLRVHRGRRPEVALPARLDPPVAAVSLSRPPEPGRRWDDDRWPFLAEGAARPFLPGLADGRAFPHDLWARCLRRAARRGPAGLDQAWNHPTLRTALLDHLARHRGAVAEPAQVIIAPSAQAALDLVARVMLGRGDLAWIESPGYGGARAAFLAAGARVNGVPLDGAGLSPAMGVGRPRLIFVTPSHQYPTGRLMPVARRRELLAFADACGALIVEDDYDSDFRYDGRPVAALQGLDARGRERVLYVGTFSKSMFADIRVGYAVVPAHLTARFEIAQRAAGQIVPAAVQGALADFIGEGHFAAHIRRMTRIYAARRDHLVGRLGAIAAGELAVEPPPGGLQLLARLPAGRDDRRLAERLAQAGVSARALSRHFFGTPAEQGLFLGFAAWTEQEIDAGCAILGELLASAGESPAGPVSSRP
jgi:GntR family transcriptional regulator/MocR family aminotransferase